MLIKIIPSKIKTWSVAASKARAKRLITYLTETKAEEKVLHTWSANTPHDSTLAIADFELTIEMNHRSQANKVEHLLISFSETDNPTLGQLQAIEEKVATHLGYQNHQRVIAVHKNTENLHIHVAINKLSPETFRIKNHYQAYKGLEDLCGQLEHEYDLARRVNSKEPPQKRSATARHYESRTGFESFEVWSKHTLNEPIKNYLSSSNPSWEGLQNVLARFDCELRLHANGCVISHREKPLYTKASGINRALSKANLESILGSFRATKANNVAPEVSYTAEPTSAKGSALYAEFKLSGARNWYAWLAEQSAKGNLDAKQKLSERVSKKRKLSLNIIAGIRIMQVTEYSAFELTTDKRGNLVGYLNGTKGITDTGNEIYVHDLSKPNLEAALQYAYSSFGEKLEFHGSGKFVSKLLALHKERQQELVKVGYER